MMKTGEAKTSTVGLGGASGGGLGFLTGAVVLIPVIPTAVEYIPSPYNYLAIAGWLLLTSTTGAALGAKFSNELVGDPEVRAQVIAAAIAAQQQQATSALLTAEAARFAQARQATNYGTVQTPAPTLLGSAPSINETAPLTGVQVDDGASDTSTKSTQPMGARI